MNSQGIMRLRRKFIFVTTLAFVSVILLMGGFMYYASLLTTRNEIHAILDYIIENDGEITEPEEPLVQDMNNDESTGFFDEMFGLGNWMDESKEFPYSIRYFAVIFDVDPNVVIFKTNHIAAVSDEDAMRYANEVIDGSSSFGRIDNYYYQVADRPEGGKIVVYLEARRQMNNIGRILFYSLILTILGSMLTILFILIFSRRIFNRELSRKEMQDRFMTNASHELKTPLAVIKANTEVEQMLTGENEWNISTMQQVERMTGLIQNLISIVRAEERENEETVKEVDVSALVKETADSFKAVAKNSGKKLEYDIEDSIVCRMSEADGRQLVLLFIDNAVKYCDDEGTVTVAIRSKARSIRFSVSNDYAEGENIDYSKFFERFYRQDESHNIKKGGYGVGLSIAESIVEKYHGKINVEWRDGVISFVCTFHNVKSIKSRKMEG